DPRTKSIIIYMETIDDARAFLSAAREVAFRKPIIVLKAGHTTAAAQAAASHTGSLAGSDRVVEAAFRRCGVLRVNTIAELFYMAEVLDKQPRPRGPRLTILTNAGGPGVLAADALLASGGRLASLSPDTLDRLDHLLPAHWSHGNPIDILSDADAARYAQALALAAKDANSEGLLVVLTPQATADPTATAELIKDKAAAFGVPLLASWMGGAGVAEGEAILDRAGIPVFPFPDTAARMFAYMWQYTENLRGLYETPMLPAHADDGAIQREQAATIIQTVRQAGRAWFNEVEAKNLLAAYGVPVVSTYAATSEQDAVRLAEQLGYPVVLKLLSATVTHKTASGGVRLMLHDAAAVRRAFREIAAARQAGGGDFQGVTVQPMIPPPGIELILGSTIDPQFGPVLLFGAGGLLAEALQDYSLALPPLTTTLARRMMERTRIFPALQQAATQHKLDLESLTQLLVRLSWLVVERPEIREIEINPLFVSGERLLALDAKVILHEATLPPEQLPRPAIRPYPRQYQSSWHLKNGTPVLIRPIRPEDEPLMVAFHQQLSARTVYLRYFHLITLTQRIAHERLTRICFIDYDREMALVVERRSDDGEGREIIAVGRLSRSRRVNEAEFAVLVSDAYQGQGLGTELLRRLLQIAAAEKIRRVSADILPDNDDMQRVCRKLGMQLRFDHEEHVVKTWIDLPVEK
ncbi:MAG: bifunctional acetate--CoA ligase family protein/GNAT family N-acetyltransferase, partial [candidate division KSB1 bacterium]|nr:bifunctional acetate--CoA ligase family protein/GNAT family N-acetyltransferase [candidate division KSB1 bacterium]